MSSQLKIPEVDRLLKKHNEDHVSIVCVNNTPQEKRKLKRLDKKLDEDLKYVNYITEQVLECLKARGCEISKYI